MREGYYLDAKVIAQILCTCAGGNTATHYCTVGRGRSRGGDRGNCIPHPLLDLVIHGLISHLIIAFAPLNKPKIIVLVTLVDDLLL